MILEFGARIGDQDRGYQEVSEGRASCPGNQAGRSWEQVSMGAPEPPGQVLSLKDSVVILASALFDACVAGPEAAADV